MKVPQLWTISTGTLLNSLVTIPEYVTLAQKYGYETIGIMDEDVLYNALQLQTFAEKAKLKPIFGLTLRYFDPNMKKNYPLHFIAKNYTGYMELMRLSTLKKTSFEKNLPLSSFQPFANSCALIFSQDSECYQKSNLATFNLQEWLANFTEIEEKYLGVSPFAPVDWQEYVQNSTMDSIYFNEVRYFKPEDAPALQVANAIHNSSHLQSSQLKFTGEKFFRAEIECHEQIIAHKMTAALENANQLIKKIDFKIPTKQHLLPKYQLPKEKSAPKFLAKLAFTNLAKKITNPNETYQTRLQMELDVIFEMGFADYFLIVWDLLKFAHEQQIFTGFGRGSAAGSLVAYVLEITGVDPIENNLLFERFLNKERFTMPDIDIDLPDTRRSEILQYVANKYGQNHVAQIATFGTLGAKQALRDVGRVLNFSVPEMNHFAKAIPQKLNITLQEAYETSVQFRKLIDNTPRNQKMFAMAQKLEGLPRHVSTHAAGVVISDTPLPQIIPLQLGSDNIFLTQFTMYDVEKLGLLKMDFLGLKNLTIIADALSLVQKNYNLNLNPSKINLADKLTLDLFRKGDTLGIFQFESVGIRRILKKMHPDSLEDIVAVNALYRPGPMENITHFIARKKGQEKVSYPDPSLANILKNTYGIIVYQEQVMQVLQKQAGFTLGQADIIRRAISKKKKDVIDQTRKDFIKGALKNGYAEANARQVYDYIEKFANYGFNRSHAFAYSMVGYVMAYLKVHFPDCFYVALLNSIQGNLPKIAAYISEARLLGMNFLAPDVNSSQADFSFVKTKQIRFGLLEIKAVRRDFVEEILKERVENGLFSSLYDFLLRLKEKRVKEKTLQPLIFAGALDSLIDNRKKVIKNLAGIVENVKLSSGNITLLNGTMALNPVKTSDFSPMEKIVAEEKYLGTYVSAHPLEKYQFLPHTSIAALTKDTRVQIIALVCDVNIVITKAKEKMAFVKVTDLTGTTTLTVFPRIFRKIGDDLKEGQRLLALGDVQKSQYDGSLQVTVAKIFALEAANTKIFLKIKSSDQNDQFLIKLKDLFLANTGKHEIVLYFADKKQQVKLGRKYLVSFADSFLEKLQNLLGAENVMFGE